MDDPIIANAPLGGATHTAFFASGYDKQSYKLSDMDDGVELAFEVSAEAVAPVVMIWAKPSGSDLTFVGEYTVTGGSMVSDRGRYWCDTIALVGTEGWDTTPDVVDNATNRLARLKFDAHGCEYILVQVKTLAAGNVSCFARGY